MDYKGYTITIQQDEDAENPRDDYNLGKMFCWHSRYNLGDSHKEQPVMVGRKANSKDYIALPLWLYDHSCLAMRAKTPADYQIWQGERLDMSANPFINWPHAAWDSGMVGWILVSKAAAREHFGWSRITKARLMQIIETLVNEVVMYSQYLSNDVWCYTIEDPNEDFHDSCCGCYGYQYCLQLAQDEVDRAIIANGGN